MFDNLKKLVNRMKQGTYFFCDNCEMPIYDFNDGYIIHGNIYTADPNTRQGLVGNNFPKDIAPGDKIAIEDISENVFCKSCLFTALQPLKKAKKPHISEVIGPAAAEYYSERQERNAMRSISQERVRRILPASIFESETVREPSEVAETISDREFYQMLDQEQTIETEQIPF